MIMIIYYGGHSELRSVMAAIEAIETAAGTGALATERSARMPDPGQKRQEAI